MFSENIINLTYCMIIKIPAFRVDQFIAGMTKCRSPMLKRTWWNKITIRFIYLNHTLVLTLSNPSLVMIISHQIFTIHVDQVLAKNGLIQ